MIDQRSYRWVLLVAIAVLMVVGTLGVVGCADDEAVELAPEPEPENGAEIPEVDNARALVESKCSRCHTLDQVWAKQQDSAGWESTVSRMESNGLQVTDEERESIIEYLSTQ